ncbi:MAG: S-adenosylmethionine:tRNA ribosyltransferase-isomerase [Thermoplasmata archaeon]
MNLSELLFDRPRDLEATRPPEDRGLARDEVRLLVSTRAGDHHARFLDLAEWLRPHDLLVVNASATLPASLPARSAALGEFRVHLSTEYAPRLWLAEPRRSDALPGPLPLEPGSIVDLAGVSARVVAHYPGLPRLLFLSLASELGPAMRSAGRPIRYAHLDREYPPDRYQTIFATSPGSAEMPSAARPFSPRVLRALRARGVGLASITLHTGVSSLDVERSPVESTALYPEPFEVPSIAADAIERVRCAGGRVIAVGTTVVRALESAVRHGRVVAARGFTRLFVHPGRPPVSFDALLTGFHDPATTHLALLYSVAGPDLVRRSYRVAVDAGYLWHEFGDSQLWLPGEN